MSRNKYIRTSGYTLVELIFAIAFLTSISAISLAGFVNIFGLFNKAQSVSRTQEETRNALDVLVRDLRNTTSIDGLDLTAPGNVSTADITPIPTLSNVLPPTVVTSGNSMTSLTTSKDAYCLRQKNGGSSIGYVLVATGAGTNQAYRLFRITSCWNLGFAQQLASLDVWSDTGISGGINALPLPAGYRPLVITRIAGGVGDVPIVWQVKLSTHRGTRVPGLTADGLEDRFSAETVLQATVNTRE